MVDYNLGGYLTRKSDKIRALVDEIIVTKTLVAGIDDGSFGYSLQGIGLYLLPKKTQSFASFMLRIHLEKRK